MKKQVTILGATGTIGKNTAELILQNPDKYSVHTLIARKNAKELAELAIKLNAKQVAIFDDAQYQDLKKFLEGKPIKIVAGKKAVNEVSSEKVDVFVSGAVGFCALEPTLSAVKAGNKIAMANKECLVCAGSIINEEAARSGAKIIPVDSEHNAIYQIFDFRNSDSIESITLTASGGPFLNLPKSQFSNITPQTAIKHPNWNMGAKISVDSATMMNKGLEVIEAFRIFPVKTSQIKVLVHPQSIIHGLVTYKDGSVLSALSNPDMKIPISYALGYPDRLSNNTNRLDLAALGSLTFLEADHDKFPCLNIALNALETSQAACVALNSANEVAVEKFLNGEISFMQIPYIVEMVVEKVISNSYKAETLEEIYFIDQYSRDIAFQLSANKVNKTSWNS